MPPPPPAEQLATRIFIGPVLRTQPDRRLVDLVRDGYDAAFEEIVRRYRKPLDRFAAGIVGGRSEDVTQDALSKALLALRGSGAEIELRPWLYRIVRNTALNDLRDRAPAAEELSERLPGGRSAAAEAESREELRDLTARLRALPEPQRAALVMRELEGLSHEEIAAALGVSGGAARQAIYRARATLREGLGLLMPLPVLRALADHAGEAGAAGGIALGGGALKAGVATVLIAGAVGGGVAVEHDRGHSMGAQAEAAAPAGGKRSAARSRSRPQATHGSSAADDDNRGRDRHSDDNGGGDNSGPGRDGSPGDGDRSGSGDSASSGGGSRSGGSSRSGGGSGSSGPSSGSGSGSGDRHGGRSGSSESSGSGSGDGSSGESGSSASSSGDGLSGGDDSGSSGPGSGGGEIESVATVSEPTLSDNSGSGGSGLDSGTSDGGSGTSGGGDLSSGSDGSP